jgi:hypothetical protein
MSQPVKPEPACTPSHPKDLSRPAEPQAELTREAKPSLVGP